MTLRWVEGFELFTNSASALIQSYLDVKYPAFGGLSNVSGTSNSPVTLRNGGHALLSLQSAEEYLETPAFTANATWIVGFAFRCENYETVSPENGTILSFMDGATEHIRLRPKAGTTASSMIMEVVRDTTVLGETPAFNNNQWYYVEVKVVINDSTGSVEVKVDESQVLNLTNQDTRNGGNATADRIRLWMGYNDGSDDLFLDDWYVCDGAGLQNNDFLGDCHIEGILPNGIGNSEQWTRSEGANNYEVVDEHAPGTDDDYIESSTASQVDTYAFEDLTRITADIAGVMWQAVAKKTNVGTRSVRAIARPLATDRVGATQSLSTSWGVLTEIWEDNPEDSADWENADVDGSEFGVELVS